MEIATKPTDGSLRRRNLERKSEQELKELLEMQKKLLQNKYVFTSVVDIFIFSLYCDFDA